jgi:hypothetical protein
MFDGRAAAGNKQHMPAHHLSWVRFACKVHQCRTNIYTMVQCRHVHVQAVHQLHPLGISSKLDP